MRLSALALLALIAACQPAGVPNAVPAPEGWTRYVLGTGSDTLPGYSIAVPSDLERRAVQGIDSQVALFEGGGIELGFDYGIYGGFGSCGNSAVCRESEGVIDGYPARERWVSLAAGPRDGRYAEIYLADIQVNEEVSLTINAACVDDAACARARAIVHTVDFGDYRELTPIPPGARPPSAVEEARPPPPPPPEPRRACMRVDEAEARSFEGLDLMGTIGDTRLYGRPGELLCSEPGPDGRGECEVVGQSEIRIEFPGGASGFRISGEQPVIFTYGEDSFSCRPRGG